MKSWHSKREHLIHASYQHQAVRSVLLKHFPFVRAFQEVPLTDLIHTPTKLRIDWYLPDYNLCIEVQGEQHYSPVAFGGDSEEAWFQFLAGQLRDREKADLLALYGFTLVYIKYDQEITKQLIDELIDEALNITKESISEMIDEVLNEDNS